MTRKHKISLAMLLIVIVAFSPFFLGLLLQHQYQKDIRNFNAMDQGRIEIKSYKRNWYHSTAVLDIEIPLAIINFLAPSHQLLKRNAVIHLSLTQKIDHGPIFYPSAANFYHLLGFAVIHNQWNLTQESKQLLQKNGFVDFAIDKNNIYVSLFANYLMNLRLENLLFVGSHKNTHVRFGSINLKGWYMPERQRIEGDLQVQDVDVKNGFSHCIIPEINFLFNQQASEMSLWTGHLDLNIKGLMWREEDEDIFSLTDVHIFGETKKYRDFISLDRTIDIGRIQFNNENVGPLHLQLTIDKLNAKVISDIIETYQTIARQGELYRNQLKKKIQLILPDIINPGTNLNLKNFSLETRYGQIQAKGKMYWPKTNLASPDTVIDFIREASANVSLTIPVRLVNTIMDLTSNSPFFNPYSLEEKSDLIKLETKVNSSFQSNKKLLIQLNEAQLIDEDALTVLMLNLRDPDFSEYYLYQVKQLFLSKEIPAYIAYLLYFYYGDFIFNVNALDKIVDKHTNDAKKFMTNTVSKAVKNGQINHKADQYTTIITRENEETKLNGKIFSH